MNRNIISADTVLVAFNGDIRHDPNMPIQVSAWDTQPLSCKGIVATIPLQEGRPTLLDAMQLSPNKDYFTLVATHYIGYGFKGWITVLDTKAFGLSCEMPGLFAAFRPSDGQLAVIEPKGDALTYWDVAACQPSRSIALPRFRKNHNIAFTPDGKYLITRRDNFQVFDAETGALVFANNLKLSGIDEYISISPDGKYFLASYEDQGRGVITALWQIEYVSQP